MMIKLLFFAVQPQAKLLQRVRIQNRASNHPMLTIQQRFVFFEHLPHHRMMRLRAEAFSGVGILIVFKPKERRVRQQIIKGPHRLHIRIEVDTAMLFNNQKPLPR